MIGRTITADPDPMSNRATGDWFRLPTGDVAQRYDEAPPYDGSTHWYLVEGRWHAFRIDAVTAAKAPAKGKA